MRHTDTFEHWQVQHRRSKPLDLARFQTSHPRLTPIPLRSLIPCPPPSTPSDLEQISGGRRPNQGELRGGNI